jgi:hypothetical protein
LLITVLFWCLDAHFTVLPKCSTAQRTEGSEREQQHWGVVLSFPCLRMFLPVLLAGAVEL